MLFIRKQTFSSGIYTGIKMAAREVGGGGVVRGHKVKRRVGKVSRSCTGSFDDSSQAQDELTLSDGF